MARDTLQQGSGRILEPFDVTVLDAGADHLWVSARSSQGEVHAVPRPQPRWPVLGGAAASASAGSNTAANGSGDGMGGTPADWFNLAIRHARPARADALAVGAALRDVVFGVAEVASLFDQTRGVAGAEGGQLLVRLLAAPQLVSSWPWELMVDPRAPGKFLALARDTHVVRAGRARTYPARRGTIAAPLHVLAVLSSPLRAATDSEDSFDLYEEKRALLAELAPLEAKGLLTVDVEDRPSIDRLRRRLGAQRRGFHILHYLGHAQPAGLKLEDRQGRGRLVPSAEFCALLQQLPDLRLAVFAGCETARAPQTTMADAWPGQLSVADLAVRDAAPAVVGMQAVLPFSAEQTFTRFFYQALTSGYSVAEALRLARLAIADSDVTPGGSDLLDWAVPCLFVGGSEPGPLLDPSTRAVAPAPIRNVGLRLGARESDTRFFARQNELREAIDVLSGQSAARVLMVLGPAGVGKTLLLLRVLDEIASQRAQLFVSARRLLADEDPTRALCRVVAELLREAGRRARPQGALRSSDWWDRLLEDLADTALTIVIDDADDLRSTEAVGLLAALALLPQRRGPARLAIAANREVLELSQGLDPSQVRVLRLLPLAWPEVWQWIRRNLPSLTRWSETELVGYFADLGPHLQLWQQLADELATGAPMIPADQRSAELTRIVQAIAQRSGLTQRDGSAVVADGLSGESRPPLFSAEPDVPRGVVPEVPRGAEPGPVGPPTLPGTASAPTTAVAPLRVAIAGPFTRDRSEQFSRAMTALAALHGVAGRISGSVDSAASAAQLLPLASPFGDSGASSDADLLAWVQSARTAAADVILLDFGSTLHSPLWDSITEQLVAEGRLVIAAGGNSEGPVWPAWCSAVLAVGALSVVGAPAPYSPFIAADAKPELYALGTVGGTVLNDIVSSPQAEGTSFAALHVVAAAVLVWATDRGLRAAEVRALLLRCAVPLQPGSQDPKRLDLDVAIRATRAQVLIDALEWAPLELNEILAETGMRSEHALAILDELVADNAVFKLTTYRGTGSGAGPGTGATERYHAPRPLFVLYEDLGEAPPSGVRRAQLSEREVLDQIVVRAAKLASRGRFSAQDVHALWQSGQRGRRLTALGALLERPDLDDGTIVADTLRNPRSAFELLQAVKAASAASAVLSSAARAALAATIRQQLAPGGSLAGADGALRAAAEGAVTTPASQANEAGRPLVDRR